MLAFFLVFCGARVLHAQRSSSYSVLAGAAFQDDARTTAAFAVSAGTQWGLPWLAILQRSVAELKGDSIDGTLRDVSLAIMPVWQPLRGRIALGAGASLHTLRRELVGAPDDRDMRVALTGMAAVRIPIAGEGVLLELLARADALEPEPQLSTLLGVRVRPGLPHTLKLGEPSAPARAAARAAVWNDVLMQLILLQQQLESFTRIREIETGIDLEFDQRALTLYDDMATVARVLAAADPPVVVTVYAPNAGRAGAGLTAGSFPAERLRLQRDARVYLRVER